MSDNLKLINCNNVKDFFDALSPLSDNWSDYSRPVFRGQGDANWGLTPKVFRSTWKSDFCSSFYSSNDNGRQVFLESSLLKDFLIACDQSGISLVGDSPEFREEYIYKYSKNDFVGNPSAWPSCQMHYLMALAQHHGVATRLLDWTYVPYVAAYFAASSALQTLSTEPSSISELAVWALDVGYIHLAETLEVVNVAGAVSVNVAAQSGLFLMQKTKGSRYDTHNDDVCFYEGEKNNEMLSFAKITLPVKFAREVLSVCKKFGFSAAKIYPSFEGAVKEVEEKYLIEKISSK